MSRHYVAAAQTDIGIVKTVNQDSLTVKVVDTAYGEVAFAVLCDGMGGLSLGEVASSHTVKRFGEWFETQLRHWLKAGMEEKMLFGGWNALIRRCNEEIVHYEKEIDGYMGTTLLVLLLVGEYYFVAHVGDCRLYEMEHGIRQITKDQTYVAREVALGHMTKEQAETDERRNVLLQCIGVNENVKPDFLRGHAKRGMSLLLCSDGFRHMIDLQELMQYCHANLAELSMEKQSREEINQAMNSQLQYLVELNKSRNEKDNISAILIKIF